jgi:hypothetical protein
VNAAALLTELEAAGVLLTQEGDKLRYKTQRGISIAPFCERILANKPALLAELKPLDREIVVSEAAGRSPDFIGRCIASIEARLILQRHLSLRPGEATFIVAAPGVGLAASAPAGPVQPERLVDRILPQHGKQTSHLRDRHRDQASPPPFSPSAAAARVTARKAWASRHSVMWRCHAVQRRTSYWSSPIALARWKPSSIVQRIPATRARSATLASSCPNAR